MVLQVFRQVLEFSRHQIVENSRNSTCVFVKKVKICTFDKFSAPTVRGTLLPNYFLILLAPRPTITNHSESNYTNCYAYSA